jgi:hypothetical protein
MAMKAIRVQIKHRNSGIYRASTACLTAKPFSSLTFVGPHAASRIHTVNVWGKKN